jgi:hypothetical protein
MHIMIRWVNNDVDADWLLPRFLYVAKILGAITSEAGS